MRPPPNPFAKIKLGLNEKGWEAIDKELQTTTKKLAELTKQIEKIGENAGTGNQAFNNKINELLQAIHGKRDLLPLIDSKMAVRALGLAISHDDAGKKARIDQALLEKIDKIRENKPTSLFIRHLLLTYFNHYDQLYRSDALANWLKKATNQVNEFRQFSPYLFAEDGAKWLVEESQRSKRDFNNLLLHMGLEKYRGGRFLFVAQNIYYLEQLKTITVNQPDPLLEELQKPDVFNARYDKNNLLGHEILRILISRAPERGVDDSWQNVVMAIAGDPRIPRTDIRYQKWWSQIGQSLIQKVIGWLSRFDLRLFLEALEDFSRNSGDSDLNRMFPARKRFLQGLENKELVTHARLYLTDGFIRYLHKHYRNEHLPTFSKVQGDKSIIYIQLGTVHLVEGSHSCKLWIYRGLTEKAIVYNYTKRSVSYRELTSGLAEKMYDKHGCRLLIDAITHSPSNWQNKAITALNNTDLNIRPEDVLSQEDYSEYKRKFDISL